MTCGLHDVPGHRNSYADRTFCVLDWHETSVLHAFQGQCIGALCSVSIDNADRCGCSQETASNLLALLDGGPSFGMTL